VTKLAAVSSQAAVRGGSARPNRRAPRPQDALDAYVVDLGRSGIAVRSLVREMAGLESLFFMLTDTPTPHPVPAQVGAP
jgi:hypothetical protein